VDPAITNLRLEKKYGIDAVRAACEGLPA